LAFFDKSIRSTFINRLKNKPKSKNFPPNAILGQHKAATGIICPRLEPHQHQKKKTRDSLKNLRV
jgi:hypothetical protein